MRMLLRERACILLTAVGRWNPRSSQVLEILEKAGKQCAWVHAASWPCLLGPWLWRMLTQPVGLSRPPVELGLGTAGEQEGREMEFPPLPVLSTMWIGMIKKPF
jgi:hypothetical protein